MEENNCTVNFVNENVSLQAERGELMSQLFLRAGVWLDTACGGRGLCGKCIVQVKTAGFSGRVKACTYIVDSDTDVVTENYERSRHHAVLTEQNVDIEFDPCIKNEYISLAEPGDTSLNLYGAAVDIGTTTVVMYIYDMNTGKCAGVYSDLNQQVKTGADVISRLDRASCGDGARELRQMILDTVNGLIDRACANIADLRYNLYEIIFCGNSAMQHLFFGFDTRGLAVSPFTCVTREFVRCSASEAGINCADRCRVTFLPLAGGFVGADTIALLLTLCHKQGVTLAVDLGTNGELAVGSGFDWLTASTACGPALEGGSLSCGMMGANGAIDSVRITYGSVDIDVIGGKEPVGICGSGVIDCIAGLRKLGIIDPGGRLIDSDECRAMLPGSPLASRLRGPEGMVSFVLCEGKQPVYITQQDIRQVQMAKSAVCCGCMRLLEMAGYRLEDVDRLVLAGAFGNYIDADNAIYIGLLPDVGAGKTLAAGNGAGAGAAMYLLNKKSRADTACLAASVKHVELAGDAGFGNMFTANLNFS